jgi:hypothetical protein
MSEIAGRFDRVGEGSHRFGAERSAPELCREQAPGVGGVIGSPPKVSSSRLSTPSESRSRTFLIMMMAVPSAPVLKAARKTSSLRPLRQESPPLSSFTEKAVPLRRSPFPRARKSPTCRSSRQCPAWQNRSPSLSKLGVGSSPASKATIVVAAQKHGSRREGCQL